ncbi:hypothetical protein TSMEX_002781 [Taenia solium]|eukprot:TsM_000206000 transcript=TsM_000206000 gene=TsM_000206000
MAFQHIGMCFHTDRKIIKAYFPLFLYEIMKRIIFV